MPSLKDVATLVTALAALYALFVPIRELASAKREFVIRVVASELRE